MSFGSKYVCKLINIYMYIYNTLAPVPIRQVNALNSILVGKFPLFKLSVTGSSLLIKTAYAAFEKNLMVKNFFLVLNSVLPLTYIN